MRDFVETGLVLGFGFITNIFSLYSFLRILWALSFPVSFWGVTIPAYLVWVALLYAVFGTVLVQIVGKPLVSLNFVRQRLEADFRFALVRLRENAEGVALYGGERDEAHVLNGRFAAIVANFRRLMSRNRYLNAMTYTYSEIASIFPWFAATPLYFAKKISFGNLSRVAGAFGEVQQSASWIVDNYATLADWAATVDRLATFRRSLDAVHAAGDGGFVAVSSAEPSVAMDNLRLALPDGNGIAARRGGAVRTGRFDGDQRSVWRRQVHPVPRSGGDLAVWQRHRHQATRHGAIPAAETLYSAGHVAPGYQLSRHRGTRIRPNSPSQPSADAGLAHLAPELDMDAVWSQRLSGGEQQRLALARALLAKPDWLFWMRQRQTSIRRGRPICIAS